MAEPAAWTSLTDAQRHQIRLDALASRVAKRRAKTKDSAARIKFRDCRTTDALPPQPGSGDPSMYDYYVDPNMLRKDKRTKSQLLYVVGPITPGEYFTIKYSAGGETAYLYLVSPSQDDIGTIPDGADGDRWSPRGESTGDQDLPNANERMLSHTLEYSGGGRRDPLLVHMNQVHAARQGMPNLEHGYTIDDLIKPVPLSSQAPPNRMPRLSAPAGRTKGTATDQGPLLPLEIGGLGLAAAGEAAGASGGGLSDLASTVGQAIGSAASSAGSSGPDEDDGNGDSRFRFRGTRDTFLPGYRRGSEASTLHAMNQANKAHYSKLSR